MDGSDQAVALIARNRMLLGHAMEERLRAQQARAASKLAVPRVMQAMRAAEQNLRAMAPSFPFRSRDTRANPPRPSAAVLREQAAKARRYARELTGDEAAQRLRELADELEAKAAVIDRTMS